MLSAAAAHRGTSLVEIYQNCPIFNDGAFDAIKSPDTKADAIIPLVHGEPIRFGALDEDGRAPRHSCATRPAAASRSSLVSEVDDADVLVHDAHNADPSTAFAISRLTDSGYLNQSPIGIFRQVERPTYDDQARAQIVTARGAADGDPSDAARRPDQCRRHLDGRLSRDPT